MTRAGTMIAQQWRQFGIDAKTDVAQGTLPTRRAAGDFDTFIGWSVETWGGHPDLSYFLDSWHSQFVAEPGKRQPPRNWQRWINPALDKIIEQTRTVGFDDPKGDRTRQGLRQAHGAGNADHSSDGLQCLHGDGSDLLDRLSDAQNPYTDPVPNWATRAP